MSDDNTKWCQNPRCPEKKNSNQIRGTKGKKYYQSNKTSQWLKYWCTNNCREEWWREHRDTCIRAVGLRVEPVKLPMESAWSKKYNYRWDNTTNENNDEHYLENKLMGIRIPITEHQYNSIGWTNDECMALASTLQSKQSA